VPRNVDAGINELEGVYLYDIDSLQSIAEQSLAKRRQQVAAAEEIIAQHVSEFEQSMAVGLRRAEGAAEHRTVGDGSLRASEL
jgi:glutamyl-tRNA reductase